MNEDTIKVKRLKIDLSQHIGAPAVAVVKKGDTVKAGQVIGYLGMTGYSAEENVNGMTVPHLHLGMQLVFNEVQKEGTNQIWIDMYALVELLNKNKATVIKDEESGEYKRVYDISDESYPDDMRHITTIKQ
jgi:murein DD-endopeptidase MepM/ murein hydrolase activator NlpD